MIKYDLSVKGETCELTDRIREIIWRHRFVEESTCGADRYGGWRPGDRVGGGGRRAGHKVKGRSHDVHVQHLAAAGTPP